MFPRLPATAPSLGSAAEARVRMSRRGKFRAFTCTYLPTRKASDVSPNSPTEDLARIKHTQDRLEAPRGFAIAYDVLFSINSGGFVAAQALPPTIRFYASIAVVFAMIGLMTWWRHRLGWWLGGYSPRRARWVGYGRLAPLIALAVWVWMVPEVWVAITAGIVSAIIALSASRLWAGV